MEPSVVGVGGAFVVGGRTEVVGQQISLQMFTKGSKGNKGKGDSVDCALHGKQIRGFGPILVITGAGALVVVVVVVVGLAVVELGQQTGVTRGWDKPVHQ